MNQAPPTRIPVAPLTAAAFAPYGDVVEHAGAEPRRYLSNPFERAPRAGQPVFWINQFPRAATLPFSVEILERHPYSAQTFVPLHAGRYLVAVTASLPDGQPDLAGLRAFMASGRQGISYRLGVWHHPLTVLDGAGEFTVMMSLTGDGDDDVFWTLPTPIELTAA
jgi:ureidoglycolate lyase